MQKTISSGISLPENLFKKIEELRGDVSRTRYVIRILENHFNEKFIDDNNSSSSSRVRTTTTSLPSSSSS